MESIDRLATEPQWVPVTWVYWQHLGHATRVCCRRLFSSRRSLEAPRLAGNTSLLFQFFVFCTYLPSQDVQWNDYLLMPLAEIWQELTLTKSFTYFCLESILVQWFVFCFFFQLAYTKRVSINITVWLCSPLTSMCVVALREGKISAYIRTFNVKFYSWCEYKSIS